MSQDQIRELQDRIKILEAREARLISLVESTPDSILGMDSEGMVTAWNTGAERILGWCKEDALGRRLSELIIPPQHRQAHEHGMRRYLKTGESKMLNRVIEVEAIHKDGRTIPVEMTVWTVNDGKGQSFGAFVRDVSERYRNQESLRNSEGRYRSVVEHLGEGMFVAQNNRVVFSNAQASQILQVANEKLYGSDPVEWIHPEDQHLLLQLREHLQRGLNTQDHYEVRHVGQDGKIRWLNIRPKPVAWDGGMATLTFFSDVTDRKSILEALKRSEERYRAVIENVDSGMVVLQGDHLVYANRRAAEIARMDSDELLKVGFLHHVHPDDHAVILDRRSRRLKGKDMPRSYEVRLQFPDGTLTWIEIGVSVIPWDGMPATITFFSDVTERKKMTHALHLSEERYRAVVEHSGEGMVVVQDSSFVFVNRRAAELVQMSVEDMLREGYLHRIHPDDKGLVDERRRKRLAGEEVPSRYEIRMLLPGGVVRWFDIGVTVVPWDGKPASLTFFSDVTERKSSEDELQRTSSEREAILQSALVGIVLSIHRHTQWCNDKFAEMLGVTRESLIGQSSVHMHPDPAQWEAYGIVQRAALSQHGTFSHQRQLKRSNGELFWVQMAGRCVRDRDPDSGVIWTFLDITDRIEAEQKTLDALEQQKELNELRSRFVAMTSHEFRTPLATILSSAELLKYYSERMPAEEKSEVIQTIENSVHRMTRMLDRVLLLGKADAQMLEFRPTEVDLRALCNSVVEEVRNQHPDTSCDIAFAFDETCRTGRYDEKLLRHIFANLLSNAVKYSPNGGTVRFAVSHAAGHVRFSVSDEGIGIPTEEIPHLFESFHRASNVGDIQGTGLGLAIVKNSVELHGGTIDVYSAAGEGTRFVVEL